MRRFAQSPSHLARPSFGRRRSRTIRRFARHRCGRGVVSRGGSRLRPGRRPRGRRGDHRRVSRARRPRRRRRPRARRARARRRVRRGGVAGSGRRRQRRARGERSRGIRDARGRSSRLRRAATALQVCTIDGGTPGDGGGYSPAVTAVPVDGSRLDDSVAVSGVATRLRRRNYSRGDGARDEPNRTRVSLEPRSGPRLGRGCRVLAADGARPRPPRRSRRRRRSPREMPRIFLDAVSSSRRDALAGR